MKLKTNSIVDIVESTINKNINDIQLDELDIIKNIIKPLEKDEDFLRASGFLEFNLSGYTEEKRFRPWQMVDDKRM